MRRGIPKCNLLHEKPLPLPLEAIPCTELQKACYFRIIGALFPLPLYGKWRVVVRAGCKENGRRKTVAVDRLQGGGEKTAIEATHASQRGQMAHGPPAPSSPSRLSQIGSSPSADVKRSPSPPIIVVGCGAQQTEAASQAHASVDTTIQAASGGAGPNAHQLVARLPKRWTGSRGFRFGIRKTDPPRPPESRQQLRVRYGPYGGWYMHRSCLRSTAIPTDRCLCLLSIFCTQYTCLDQPQLCSFSYVVVNGCSVAHRIVSAFQTKGAFLRTSTSTSVSSPSILSHTSPTDHCLSVSFRK